MSRGSQVTWLMSHKYDPAVGSRLRGINCAQAYNNYMVTQLILSGEGRMQCVGLCCIM